jgi:hypothetical protein
LTTLDDGASMSDYSNPLDDPTCLSEAYEYVLVGALLAQPAIEAFDKRVLRCFPGSM